MSTTENTALPAALAAGATYASPYSPTSAARRAADAAGTTPAAVQAAVNAAVLAELKVGDGATVHGWSDAYAATIVAVGKGARTITVQRDRAELLNGPNSDAEDALTFAPGGFLGHTSGAQRWRFERDEDAPVEVFSLRSTGRYVLVGQPAKGGRSMTPGVRRHHFDYNF